MKRRMKLIIAAGLYLAVALPATAAEYGAGLATPLGDRYLLLELYQPDRNLNVSDPYLNVLFDTQNGRSWTLRYTLRPGTNERGFVWVEIPFAAPAKGSR